MYEQESFVQKHPYCIPVGYNGVLCVLRRRYLPGADTWEAEIRSIRGVLCVSRRRYLPGAVAHTWEAVIRSITA
jgi:hypothetical protein